VGFSPEREIKTDWPLA